MQKKLKEKKIGLRFNRSADTDKVESRFTFKPFALLGFF